jgi:hypothetical protein
MALRISRRSWVLGRPNPLGEGRWGFMYLHSASDKSVGYVFLMRARVAKYPPRTTFHTASEEGFSEVSPNVVTLHTLGYVA